MKKIKKLGKSICLILAQKRKTNEKKFGRNIFVSCKNHSALFISYINGKEIKTVVSFLWTPIALIDQIVIISR